MRGTLYLGWRYLASNPLKTSILLTSITLILYLPVGLRVLVGQSSEQLIARAVSTPLIVGAKGSPLELVLNSIYFRAEVPDAVGFAELGRIEESGLGRAIPLNVRFRAREWPIVGTSLDYFELRGLRVGEGRQIATLGECVVGARVARALDLVPGGYVVSSPESLFDLAGVYPLKMTVTGVLEASDSADDDAIFVDVKTAWIIEGFGHGHQDLTREEAAASILSRDETSVTANASLVQYNEITPENIDSFHFHGELGTLPITGIVVVPPDRKSATILQGRFLGTESDYQIVHPEDVMHELMATVFTVERFVVAGALIVGLATLGSACLVFSLSLRLRRREMETLFKIGGSRTAVGILMIFEIGVILVVSVLLAGVLTGLTHTYGAIVVRTLIRS